MDNSAYYTAWEMTQNIDLMMRVAAAAQQEAMAAQTPDFNNPEDWARARRWEWATKADWIAAVQSAKETGITVWGINPNVITDGMILSYVQPAVAP